MKYLFSIVALFLVVSSADAQKKVQWMSWEEAMTASEKNPKKIYIDIYTDWCGYCKKMDNTTFKDPSIVKYLNDNFHPVKFNAEQKESITFNDTEFNFIKGGRSGVHELAYALLNGQLGYPAFVVLDEEFSRILISPGFKGPDAVMMEMKFASEEKYKTVAWPTYQKQYMAALNPKPAVDTKMVNAKTPKSTTANTRSASLKRDTIPQKAVDIPPPPPPRDAEEEEEVFKVVEVMPRFPGCEDMDGTNQEKTKCAESKMLQFVYKNLEYPAKARENGVEGIVVTQFIVGKDGVIKDKKILRDLGAGCGDAAMDVLNKFPNWIPGKQRGRPVDVQYTMPVRFKLEKSTKPSGKGTSKVPVNGNTKVQKPKANNGVDASTGNSEVRKSIPPPPPPPPPLEDEGEIFKVVEQMPRFSGCEDIDGSKEDVIKCAEERMLNFIYDNLVYPAKARENKIEGMVVVQFVIEESGKLTDAKVVRDIGAGCADATMDVIKMMPDWVPGMQRGNTVRVLYTLPVRFKLERDKLIDMNKGGGEK